MSKRYFIDKDSSGHNYLVDASKKTEWRQWAELDEDNEAAWDAPDFAYRINHTNSITFELPEEFDKPIAP